MKYVFHFHNNKKQCYSGKYFVPSEYNDDDAIHLYIRKEGSPNATTLNQYNKWLDLPFMDCYWETADNKKFLTAFDYFDEMFLYAIESEFIKINGEAYSWK